MGVGAVTIAALLVGCARPPEPQRAVRIAIHSEPLSFDPHLHNEILTFSVLSNIYEGITAFDSDFKPSPALAESWENPDERTWRFRLREDARFSDGRPVEAADVVSSLARARRRTGGSLGSYLIDVDREEAEGPRTVVLHTRRPSAVLLSKLTYIGVVPRDAPDDIRVPIGTGPYRLAARQEKGALRLEPRGDAARRTGRSLSPIEFVPLRSGAERTAALLEGRVDLVQDLETGAIPRVSGTSGVRVFTRPSTTIECLYLATKDARFDDIRVRRAIHLAIDRVRFVRDSRDGQGLPASQMVGPGVFGFDPEIPLPKPDRAAARRLLAEAGFPDGFAVDLEYRSGRRGDLVAAQLREIGIRVTPKESPWTELYPRYARGEIAFYLGGAVAVTADGSDIFDSMAHTRSGGYGRTNFIGYSNPELDALIERSGEVLDMTSRRAVLQSAMRVLMQDLRLVPLTIPNDVYGVRANLSWKPRLDRFLKGAEMTWTD